MNDYNDVFKKIIFQDEKQVLNDIDKFVKDYFHGLKLSLRTYVHDNY